MGQSQTKAGDKHPDERFYAYLQALASPQALTQWCGANAQSAAGNQAPYRIFFFAEKGVLNERWKDSSMRDESINSALKSLEKAISEFIMFPKSLKTLSKLSKGISDYLVNNNLILDDRISMLDKVLHVIERVLIKELCVNERVSSVTTLKEELEYFITNKPPTNVANYRTRAVKVLSRRTEKISEGFAKEKSKDPVESIWLVKFHRNVRSFREVLIRWPSGYSAYAKAKVPPEQDMKKIWIESGYDYFQNEIHKWTEGHLGLTPAVIVVEDHEPENIEDMSFTASQVQDEGELVVEPAKECRLCWLWCNIL